MCTRNGGCRRIPNARGFASSFRMRSRTMALRDGGISTESLWLRRGSGITRSEEHTSELQSLRHLVCRLLLEKKKKRTHGKDTKLGYARDYTHKSCPRTQ